MKKYMKRFAGCLCLTALLFLTACARKLEAGSVQTSSGTEFSAGGLVMQAEKQEIRTEVKPSNPQGYYNHYKEQEGYYYHVISGTIKNTADHNVDLDNIRVTAEDADGNVSEAKLVAFNKREADFWYSLESGQNVRFYLFSIVKEKQDVPDTYRIYMDEDGKIEKEQETFDFCYEFRYELPSAEKK